MRVGTDTFFGFLKRIAVVVPWLGSLLVAVAVGPSTGPSVSLGWDSVSDPMIAGYRLYQGVVSRSYTSVIEVGNSTTVRVPGLVGGITYYFAVTAYDLTGLESAFSSEISYTAAVTNMPARPQLSIEVSPAKPGQMILNGSAPAGYNYDLLASQDLRTWLPIANITVDATGRFTFTDTSAPTFAQRFYQLRETSPQQPGTAEPLAKN